MMGNIWCPFMIFMMKTMMQTTVTITMMSILVLNQALKPKLTNALMVLKLDKKLRVE